MVYPALLPLMRTPRLPVVDWIDAPADLNGLVRFAERRNMVSARAPSHFKRSQHRTPPTKHLIQVTFPLHCTDWPADALIYRHSVIRVMKRQVKETYGAGKVILDQIKVPRINPLLTGIYTVAKTLPRQWVCAGSSCRWRQQGPTELYFRMTVHLW